MAHYLMADLLKYLWRDLLMSAIYQKMHQGTRSIVDWIEGWTNGQNGDKGSIVKQAQTQDPYIFCLQETHLSPRDTYRVKVKGWNRIFHTNRDQNKAGVAVLISGKIHFEIKALRRYKEGHYILIKGSIQEENIAIINIYPASP